jgi:succinyl-diaminopimelate desuccinylase
MNMTDIQVNESRLIDLTQRLVQINSEYSEGIICNHDEIVDFLLHYSKEMGLEVHRAEPEKGYPVVMAKLPGSEGKPVLGFIGHYNTHPIGDIKRWNIDPLSGVVKDGYIWGRGVADMKKNISAAIEAVHSVKESSVQLKGDVVLIWFAGEGHHDSALEYMATDGRKFAPVDWYIDMDWCEGKIAKVAGPWVWLKIKTHGRNGHSALLRGDGSKPINAIGKMGRLITEMLNVDNWLQYHPHELFNKSWRYSDKPIVEINTIQGGEKVNEVADECTAMVDFRLLPGQSPQGLLEDLNALIERLRAEDDEFLPVDIDVFKTTYSRPWELTADHPVVKAIHESAQLVIGQKPEWQGLLFGSRPPLWEVAEVIHYGIAGGRDYHGFDESTRVEDLIQGAKIYVGMILKLLK